MIRTFLLLDNTLAETAAKLVCGANYVDGSPSMPVVKARSVFHALDLMATYQRKKALWNLKWTREPTIRSNLQHTLQLADPFFATIAAFAAELNEMRIVRNHVAHGTRDTLKQFRTVVVRHYGTVRRGVNPAVMLLARHLGARPLLERYIISVRVFVKALLRA